MNGYASSQPTKKQCLLIDESLLREAGFRRFYRKQKSRGLITSNRDNNFPDLLIGLKKAMRLLNVIKDERSGNDRF